MQDRAMKQGMEVPVQGTVLLSGKLCMAQLEVDMESEEGKVLMLAPEDMGFKQELKENLVEEQPLDKVVKVNIS